jgi:hypothetical protein
MQRHASALSTLVALLVTVGGGGCGSSGSTIPESPATEPTAGAAGVGGQSSDDDARALTYHRDAAPVLNRYCTTCHRAGGLAPFRLDTYADAKQNAAVAAAAVLSHDMPPLPPDLGCRELDDPRVMPDEHRQRLLDWVTAGALEGDPNDIGAALPEPQDLLGPADVELDSGLDYVSEFPGTDEYRCFLLDTPIDEATDAIAFAVKSSNLAIVHHAFVEMVRPEQLDAVKALDAADDVPGWECFGGPGFDAVRVGGYVPGAQTKPYPNGTGVTVPAGARFVANVHYNFLNNRDANRLAIQMWKAKQPLSGSPRNVRLSNRTFVIPAGATGVSASDEANLVAAGDRRKLDQAVAGRAWGASGHMHLLGQAVRIDLIHADQTEECLLSIPAWDFHWQGDYRWKEPLTLVPGDTVRLTCTWDNSAEHQPTIDGVQQAPRTVRWGEKSTDEMCLGNLSVTD